jgi:hypothetical protein
MVLGGLSQVRKEDRVGETHRLMMISMGISSRLGTMETAKFIAEAYMSMVGVECGEGAYSI